MLLTGLTLLASGFGLLLLLGPLFLQFGVLGALFFELVDVEHFIAVPSCRPFLFYEICE